MAKDGGQQTDTGSILGVVLIGLGAGLFLIAAAWAGSSYAAGELSVPALVLGLGLAFVVAGPVAGAGVLMRSRGRREARRHAIARKERTLLGMVQAQGQVNIDDIAIELDASRAQVKAWIYDLVDKGLFAGYTDWRVGTLYSREASRLRGKRCPNCGGEVELAGKGTIACPFCDAEIYLTE